MTQREGTREVDLPGRHTYDIGMARPSGTAPFYEHQTILEWFDSWSIGPAGSGSDSGSLPDRCRRKVERAKECHFLSAGRAQVEREHRARRQTEEVLDVEQRLPE